VIAQLNIHFQKIKGYFNIYNQVFWTERISTIKKISSLTFSIYYQNNTNNFSFKKPSLQNFDFKKILFGKD